MSCLYRSGFNVSQCVEEPESLFGWNRPGNLLDRAIGDIEAGHSFMVRGERRSGKTSFLHCLKARIGAECPHITVSLVNFSGCGIDDAVSAHKYVIEKVLEALFDDARIDWLPDPLPLGGMTFVKNGFHGGLAQLDGVPDMQHCLTKLDQLLKQHGHRVVIFFDEYESMHEAFGGGMAYFNTYRELQQGSRAGGISSIVAGAESTDSFSGRTGSPQFNHLHPIYITGIDIAPFQEMWHACLGECSPLCRQRVEEQMRAVGGIEEIHALCGGRPAYAKALGDFWASGEAGDEPPLLAQWFRQILNRLSRYSDGGKRILLALARGNSLNRLKVDNKNEILEDLRLLDLVRKNEDSDGPLWSVVGGFWQRFLERCDDTAAMPESDGGSVVRETDATSLEDVKDGISLALWFLGHSRFSSSLLHRCRERDWLEFKRALYCDPPADTVYGAEHFPGLCTGCKRRANVKPGEKCWENCEERNKALWEVSKAAIALANTGGGVLLLGVDDSLPEIGYIPASLRESARDAEAFFRMKLRPAIVPENGTWYISAKKQWRVVDDSQADYLVWRNDGLYFREEIAEDGSRYAAVFVYPLSSPLLLRALGVDDGESCCFTRVKGEGSTATYKKRDEKEAYLKSRPSSFSCAYYQAEARTLLRNFLQLDSLCRQERE